MTRSTEATRTPVTLIGLGAMGSALGQALLAAGHSITVWNRTASKAAPLAGAGAEVATSVRQAVDANTLVVTCLVDFDQTREVLDQGGADLADKDLVTLNTGSPAGARAVAEWAGARGARFLAGAVKNVPEGVGDAETLLYYSGDRSVFDQHLPTLRVLGGDTDYLGEEPDLAALYELAVGGMLLPALMGFYQGAAALQARELSAVSMVRYAQKWLDMVKMVLPDQAARIDRRDYRDPSSSLDLFLSMQAAEHDLARETGVDVSWQAPTWARLRRAAEHGYGDRDIAVVTELLRESRAGEVA